MLELSRRGFVNMGALAGAAALAGCMSRTAGSAGLSSRLSAPESAGMSRTGLEGIRAAIQKNIDARLIPGAVSAVARHGKLVWLEAQGLADVATGRPMQEESLFRIMSSTKVITAVATLMMIDEGKLALHDPVSKFIPSFADQKVALAPPGTTDMAKVTLVPANRDITVKDLLTHTSGLTTSAAVPAIASLSGKVGRQANATLADVIPKLGSLPLDYQPGTLFRYSPLDAMDTLLYLVELVSRTPAERFLHERLFQPLEMRRTWFNVPPSEKEDLVQIYKVTDGTFVPQRWLFGDGPFSYISGAGGLVSSALDMLNFEQMLLDRGTFKGRRLLRPETVDLMATNHVGRLFAEWFPPLTGGHGFGLGVRIVEDPAKGGGRSVGAFGWGGAYGTESWADPALGVAAVLLVQIEGVAPNVKDDFAKAIRQAIVA